jgi:hypothetical protein
MSFRRIADLCGVLVDLRVADEELRSRAHDAEDGSTIRMKIRARRKHGVSFPEEVLDLQRFKSLANGMKECSTEKNGPEISFSTSAIGRRCEPRARARARACGVVVRGSRRA